MKRSNRLLILVGVFLAVVAMVGVVVVMGGGGTGGAKGSPTPSPEPTVQVVYAKADMALGDRITADMVELKTKKLSERGVDTFSSLDDVIGKVAGGNITKGSPLSSSSFLSPGAMNVGQDIASAIAPGKLAVSMEVDQVNGVGTLVVPGDRVDVILSMWVAKLDMTITTNAGKDEKWPLGGEVTTKVIIQNRRVMATLLPGAETSTTGNQAVAGTPTPAPKATQQTITNSGQHMIVILEVQPDEAEMIRYAQRVEKEDPQNYITLSLALRSDKDNDAPNATTPGITFRQLVTIYGVLPPDFRAAIPADLARLFTW